MQALLAAYREMHGVEVIKAVNPRAAPHIVIWEAPPVVVQELYTTPIQDCAYGQRLTVPYKRVHYVNHAPYRYEMAARNNGRVHDTDAAGDKRIPDQDGDSGYESVAVDNARDIFSPAVIVSPCGPQDPYYIEEDDDDLPDLSNW